MPGAKHASLVASLCNRTGATAGRFQALVFEALRGDYETTQAFHSDSCSCEDCDEDGPVLSGDNLRCVEKGLWAYIKTLRLRPDAARLDADRKVVAAYEVEVASPISNEKLARYVECFWLFDGSSEWNFELYIVDGRDGHLREFELALAAYRS